MIPSTSGDALPLKMGNVMLSFLVRFECLRLMNPFLRFPKKLLAIGLSLIAISASGQLTVSSNYTPGASNSQQFIPYSSLPLTNLVSIEAVKLTSGDILISGSSVATEFTASVAANVTSIQVPLVRVGGYVTPDLGVSRLVGSLWTSEANRPGTLVGMFSAPVEAITDPNSPYGAPAVTFSPQGAITVEAGVSYFFQVGASADTSWVEDVITQQNVAYSWTWEWQRLPGEHMFLVASNVDPDTADWTSYVDSSSGSITVSRFDPVLGQIVSTEIPGLVGGIIVTGNAIPEPSTYACLVGIVTFIGTAAIRRRKGALTGPRSEANAGARELS